MEQRDLHEETEEPHAGAEYALPSPKPPAPQGLSMIQSTRSIAWGVYQHWRTVKPDSALNEIDK